MPAPLKRALKVRIGEMGGYSAILERIQNGETLMQIAPDYGVTRGLLSTVLNKNKRVRPLLAEARRAAAHAHAEKALDIIEAAPVQRDHLEKAKLRASHHTWLAKVYDRETFGDQKEQPNQVLIVGQLHLDALRAQPRVPFVELKQIPQEASHG
jgi:hypothetical protein